MTLDLKSADERGIFESMIREADVFIQNFRPGTAARLGAGPDRLLEINPRLVYCSISGFGSSGPYVERPSYDSVAQALSGFLSVVVDADRPRFLGPALCRCHHRHLCRLWHPGCVGQAWPDGAGGARRSVHAGSHGALRGRAIRRVFRVWNDAHVERQAAARASVYSAHRGPASGRHPSVVHRKVLGGTGRGDRRTGSRSRSAFQCASVANCPLRGTERRTCAAFRTA